MPPVTPSVQVLDQNSLPDATSQVNSTPVTGYEKVARFMSEFPQTAIFQRFDFLNALNLLYMQAELVEKEKELKDCLKNDRESQKLERRNSTQDWAWFSDLDSDTWRVVLSTRKLLKEYNEALHLQTTLHSVAEPNQSDLELVQEWFLDTKKGDRPLLGQDQDIWMEARLKSLIPLKSQKGQDPLATLFLFRISSWWYDTIGYRFMKPKDLEAQFVEFDDKTFETIANISGSVISSSILVGSIITLYYLDSMKMRLVAIGIFTQIFSLVLVLLTGARKVDMFAATAAFVAVQVVFVSSTNTSGTIRQG